MKIKFTLRIPLGKLSWMLTPSTWSGNFVCKWFLVGKLLINQVTRKMTSSFISFFNKKTIKLSYSCCMRNIAKLLSLHNKTFLLEIMDNYGCNCRDKDICPMKSKCLTHKVIYRANVSRTKVMKKSFILDWLKNRWKEDMTIIKHLLDMNDIKTMLIKTD